MSDEQTAREIIRQAFTEPIDDCNEWIESPLDCGARNALAALAEAGYVLTTMDEVRRIEIEYGESIALVSPDGSAAERSET